MTAQATRTPSPQEALEQRLAGKLFATTTECAEVLRYDVRTLLKAIKANEVPAVKAGSTYRIPVAWILQQALLGS